jgi:hypothetical protein
MVKSLPNCLANVSESGDSLPNCLGNVGISGESQRFLKRAILANASTRTKMNIFG